MGTVLDGRFHDREILGEIFSAVGFETVDTADGEGPTLLHAVR